jgi:hypothetical protein
MTKKPAKLPTKKEMVNHINLLHERQSELLKLVKTNSQALYNYIYFKKDLDKFNTAMQKKMDELNTMNNKEKSSNLKKEAENEPKKEK